MEFTSKLELTDRKTYQDTGGTLNLSGTTYLGTAQYLTPVSGSNVTARTIPDAAWVTGKTDVITASNGLTKDNQVVKLGGELTENTTITGTNYNFNILDATTICLTPSNMFTTANHVAHYTECPDDGNYGYYQFYDNYQEMSTSYRSGGSRDYNSYIGVYTRSIEAEGWIISDGIDFNSKLNVFHNRINLYSSSGISSCSIQIELNYQNFNYRDDNSINYTARSIPDVGYVTGLTSNISSNSLTGATNGLTENNNTVKLGGELIENTTISGTSDLNINLNNINLTSTLFLNTVASGTTSNNILTITAGGEVRKISSDLLGEDNNNYDVTGITASTINLTGDEYVILVDTSLSAVTVNLVASPVTGSSLKIKDKSGNALNNIITVDGNGNNIDGSATALINTNYGSFEFVFDGTEWFSLSAIY